MKRILILTMLLCSVMYLFAARKALVIGNGNYGQNSLRNAVVDANDFAGVMGTLGFDVTLGSDLELRAFDQVVDAFTSSIRGTDEVVFYYSGHGLQFGGENFLIPALADIKDEKDLKYDAVNANRIAEYLQKAAVSILILDACRENPFRNVRSTNRGLAVIDVLPGMQCIFYSTANGKTAEDGTGRNSPFTGSLLKYIAQPGLELTEVFRNVSKEVKELTSYKQTPFVYGNLDDYYYFAKENTPKAREIDDKRWIIKPMETPKVASLEKPVSKPEEKPVAIPIEQPIEKPVSKSSENHDTPLMVKEIVDKPLTTKTPHPAEKPSNKPVEQLIEKPVSKTTEILQTPLMGKDSFVLVKGGTFNNGTSNVTISSLYMDKNELTQAGYQAVMGTNPATGFGVGGNYPVYYVSWFNAIEYCNRRSLLEGLTPCYSYSTYGSNPTNWPTGWNAKDINHTNISCNWIANGYRLPTEMEWQFSARGGNQSRNYTYSGSNDLNVVGWYGSNSDTTAHKCAPRLPTSLVSLI